MSSEKAVMETSESYQISHEEVWKYTGKYAAVMDGKIVASGDRLYQKIEELEKSIRTKNPSHLRSHRRLTRSIIRKRINSSYETIRLPIQTRIFNPSQRNP